MSEQNQVKEQLPPEGKFTLELNGNKFLATLSDKDISLAKIGGEEKLIQHLTTIAMGEHSEQVTKALDTIKLHEIDINAEQTRLADIKKMVSDSAGTIAHNLIKDRIDILITGLNQFNKDELLDEVTGEVVFKGNTTIVNWKLAISTVSGSSVYSTNGSNIIDKDHLTAIDQIEEIEDILTDKRTKVDGIRKDYEELVTLTYSIQEAVKVKVANYMLKYAGLDLDAK